MSRELKYVSDEDKEHLKELGVPNDVISRLREPRHEQVVDLKGLFERDPKWFGRHRNREGVIDLSNLIIRHPEKRYRIFECKDLELPSINFSGSIFGASAKLNPLERQAVYSASFCNTKFHGDTEFFGAHFIGIATFLEAQFKANVNFNNAVFYSRANFTRSKFNQRASFREANFREDALFIKSSFDGDNVFSSILFEGDVYFTGALFKQTFSCSRMTCIDSASFDMAHFNSTVALNSVRWGALPSFRNTSFQQKPSSEYMDSILDLLNGRVTARKLKLLNSLYRHKDITQETLYILRDIFDEGNRAISQLDEIRDWVERKKDYVYRDELLSILQEGQLKKLNDFVERRAGEETSLRKYHAVKAALLGDGENIEETEEVPEYETIPLSDKIWREDTEAPDKIRFFRLLCNETGDHYREHKYFSLEMKAHSHHRETGYMLKAFYWLYGEMSEYGYSVMRPLLIWLYCSFYGWVLFMASGIEDKCRKSIDLWDTLPFYLGNLLPFFGSSYTARKSLGCSQEITFEGHMITLANSGISMLCIFLLFLALRNRFRL